MAPHRPITARRLNRKPLGDCTNTTISLKFANPNLTSSLKRLINQTSSLKDKTQNDAAVTTAPPPKSLSTNLRPVTRRVSADLSFPSPTPSKRKDVDESEGVSTRGRLVTRRVCTSDLDFPASRCSGEVMILGGVGGGGDKEVAERYSVYTVTRKAASGRKKSNKVASSSSAVASLRLDLIPNPGKKRRQANENTVKTSKVAPIKRQRTTKHEEDNVANGLSQEYIEKQRAYFAEIDAFELAEEEVSDSDLD
ncbi:unnamed protein product [Eruca vesicaria subsp. sativa]|uniref:Sororin C-terminal region domain-containing protein n=1 Tax=Eruca vesicaria subsp. sativa TaxID=29727 RepID=A0ABC8KVW4_ERUVS|nr:unnamed protein product [Eruca vesicaria subsp. sativa]